MILATMQIDGYDVAVLAETEAACIKALRKEIGPDPILRYHDDVKQWIDDECRFTEIEVGKVVYT